jgi:hypothetical protein
MSDDIFIDLYALTYYGDKKVNSEDKREKYNLLISTLKSDFKNESLHNVIIDFCIDNDMEMDLVNFYKSKSDEYPELCKEMLDRLSDRSISRLYNTKIKKKSEEDSRRLAIKLILILIGTIIAMYFIWKGLLSSFKNQFLQ